METQEEKKTTKPRAKKTKFGDVKKLLDKDGKPRDITDKCYFYLRDYTKTSDEQMYEKTLRVFEPYKFFRTFSPFERGRPLAFLKSDDVFAEYTTDIKGILTLKKAFDDLDDKKICSKFGLSLRSDKKFIAKIRKELKYLSIGGSKAKRVTLSDLIQVFDIDKKELHKEDLV